MLAVSNDHAACRISPYEEQRRQFAAIVNLLAIFFDVRVTDAEQRQAGRPKDIFRFEPGYGSTFEFSDIRCCSLLVEEQRQVRFRCRIVVVFWLVIPLNWGLLAQMST